MDPISYTLIPSAFGPIAIAWGEVDQAAKAWHILLSDETARAEDRLAAVYPGCLYASHPAIDGLARRIARFLQGQAVAFDLSCIALERCSDFQRRVLVAEHAIPRGWISTYGRIAAHLGEPRAARAVGNAFARNPFPLVIPCHRAVRADGRLGGYQGGLTMKRCLLQLEGVQVSDDGRLIDPRIYY
jgi:methylated-DNA-[protein]-cysteine S-methyltransferase